MAFPTRLQTLLDEGRISLRSAAKFEFGTGTYGIWNGKGPITYSGLTYVANQLLELEELPMGMGTQATPMKMKMPAKADFGVTPDRLALIENEAYKGKPVTIYDFYFDPDNMGAGLLHAEPKYYGYIDTISHVLNGEDFYLEASIETSAIDNFRDGYRTASHEDQQLVSAGDRFFEYASIIKNEDFDIEL